MRAGGIVAAIAAAVIMGAWSQGALDISTPQYGRLAAASVTASSAGTANTVITLSGRRRIVVCTNSLNAETILTYNGSNWIFVPSSTSVAIDLSASGLTLSDSKVVGVYYVTGAPASGSIACTAH